MTTIVATFSPETFGAKNARMLNWMQWIRAGGSERCDLVTSPMFLTRQLCILDHCRFSQLECTAEDADQLSLDFLVAPHLICDAMKHSQTPSVIRQELREVFACVDTSLNAQMIFYIKEVVQTLRLHLYRRFSSFNPASDFTPAFSPAVFGWRNAYLLNCLQCVYETAARRSYFTDDFWKQTLVTRMAGTESGAEWLSKYYVERVGLLQAKLSGNATEPTSAELRDAFLVGEMQEHSRVLDRLKMELSLLRVSLYSSPRFVAFLLGKHRRVGAAGGIASLGDDVCRMILTLSVS